MLDKEVSEGRILLHFAIDIAAVMAGATQYWHGQALHPV